LVPCLSLPGAGLGVANGVNAVGNLALLLALLAAFASVIFVTGANPPDSVASAPAPDTDPDSLAAEDRT